MPLRLQESRGHHHEQQMGGPSPFVIGLKTTNGKTFLRTSFLLCRRSDLPKFRRIQTDLFLRIVHAFSDPPSDLASTFFFHLQIPGKIWLMPSQPGLKQ